MNHWTADGSFSLHVFHKNNELAGYCSVLHALQLIGTTGDYGRRLRAAVIGFGAAGRGAVTALNAHGVSDVDILTHRDVNAVGSPIHSARIVRFEQDAGDPSRSHALPDERPGAAGAVPGRARHRRQLRAAEPRRAADVRHRATTWAAFAPGSLIVDVSCDEGMGFGWARPTSFAEPMFTVGDNVHYYAVDHSPSLPVGLRHLGDQRGPAAAPADRARRPDGLGRRPDHPAGHRDPRRRHPEPAHPVLPAPFAGLPAPGRGGLRTLAR